MLERTYSKDFKPEKIDFLEGALLLVDKPLEWTSFDVVNKIRHTLRYTLDIGKKRKVKVGHAGTLDPMATGLLLVCTGKYTKQINQLTGLPKSYTGTIKLGASTPSYDRESEEDALYPIDHITPEMLKDAVKELTGPILQKPPIYSAIKKKGEKLYQLARRGEDVEIEPRPVTIESFQLLNDDLGNLEFEVTCSKGTYIRSLAHDLGQLLDSGGYLTSLRRDAVGMYPVDKAFDIEEVVDWIRASAIKPE